MNQNMKFENTLTMSSLEIAELVGSRHDKVKQSIERLAEQAVISLPPLVEVKIQRERRVETISVYKLCKRDSLVVVELLLIAGREKLNPISLDAAAGVVAGMRPTTEKIGNVALCLVATFAALPQGEQNDISADNDAYNRQGMYHLTALHLVSRSSSSCTPIALCRQFAFSPARSVAAER